MRLALISFFDRSIEFLFYGLFLLLPLVFTDKTSELFEFNKMWLTFAITALIMAFWISSMFLKREFRIVRTPLDIPIVLFLISQFISTIFSLDIHVSLWGYYSRFNGGFLSILSYILLYYAFVSNFVKKTSKNEDKLDTTVVKRSIFVSIFSGVLVALWGFPSHFGYDPTCLIFRGSLNVECWTADFQPKVRIFSTMGQPDWLAAQLAILLPLSLAFFVKFLRPSRSITNYLNRTNLTAILFLFISFLFYVDLLFTKARSGFIAFWVSMAIFPIILLYKKRKNIEIKQTLMSKATFAFLSLLIITFVVGTPIATFNKFDLESLGSHFKTNKVVQIKPTATPASTPVVHGEFGGTDSGKIRLIVWKGAINAWKNNPVFGTGVETFAFAYYKYKLPAHNLTSEWNFLYNKAHNEFLNYLATTGSVGFLTYTFFLTIFGYISLTAFGITNRRINKALEKIKININTPLETDELLVTALIAGFISILITDFFGFSVVLTNLYLFLIPLFVLILMGQIDPDRVVKISSSNMSDKISLLNWVELSATTLVAVFILYFLFNSWVADTKYAYGQNLDHINQYQQAYTYLHDAVKLRDEPVFKDEMSINDAALATVLVTQTKDQNSQTQAIAQGLAQEAISTNNSLTDSYPNNILYWKSKVRIYYTLAQVNKDYLPLALSAIQKASLLAPTDASIFYNLGVIYGQSGDSKNAVKNLEYTVQLKPDYADAHYALGLFYHDLGVDSKGNVTNKDFVNKAVDQMEYILKNLNPDDQRAKDSIAAWAGK